MGEFIKHECGIAFVRLRKPLEYYEKKYGTSLYGLYKLQLLMQKQRNRGQDGAGVVSLKLHTAAGKQYLDRKRTNNANALKIVFGEIFDSFKNLSQEELHDPQYLYENSVFTGELLMGHLRYGTYSTNDIENVHPVLRRNNWRSRNLALMGNFNLTNVEDLFEELISYGQHPNIRSDTTTVLEKIGHFLDREVQNIFDAHKDSTEDHQTLSDIIRDELDIAEILRKSTSSFDGGYVIGGVIGNGGAFLLKDPCGIRPAYYYVCDEFIAAASERPALQTTFDTRLDDIRYLKDGHALIVNAKGSYEEVRIAKENKNASCSFERIYFSRGTDKDIYLERKKLGTLLTKKVLKAIEYDFENSVFSFIPNTAETAFLGLIKGLENELAEIKKKRLLELNNKNDLKAIQDVIAMRPRVENLVVKDEKLRTFITDDQNRDSLVSHVYDVTYGIVKNHKDTLVLIDDSIVRGTTLKESIISIMARLKPKKIIILSSAPQIRYPDCYGIDMSRMNEFIAFKAMLQLLKENKKLYLLQEVFGRCLEAKKNNELHKTNFVRHLYDQFSDDEISQKIAELVTPKEIKKIDIQIIYQSVESLGKAMPGHSGDWYFSGNYPTPGGNVVVNKSFMYFIERNDQRAY